MLIVGINGSPRREGNTAVLLKTAMATAAAEGAATEVVFVAEILASLKTPFCRACETPCPAKCYRGTLLEETLGLLARADGLLVASPVYFGEISGQLKSFWDLSRRLRTDKKLLNVVGGALSVGAARFGGQETTLKAIHNMMLIQGMIVVGNGHGNNDAGHFGAPAQQPAEEDENGLKRAHVLAKRVVQVARATAGLRSSR